MTLHPNETRGFWNSRHTTNVLENDGHTNAFAHDVASRVRNGSRLLEIGCGIANDAKLFHAAGADVTATDIADKLIEYNNTNVAQAGLQFLVTDILQPLQFSNRTFDIVYAFASLHYFTDKQTKQIFAELHRILKPSGLLCFACKTTQDPKYGEGTLVEPDMYMRIGKNGQAHARHFFSEQYTRALLATGYEIKLLEQKTYLYDNEPSNFIHVIAGKL